VYEFAKYNQSPPFSPSLSSRSMLPNLVTGYEIRFTQCYSPIRHNILQSIDLDNSRIRHFHNTYKRQCLNICGGRNVPVQQIEKKGLEEGETQNEEAIETIIGHPGWEKPSFSYVIQ
jgi:hypothetical protein